MIPEQSMKFIMNLKKDKDIKGIVHPTSYISENSNLFHYLGYQIQKQFFAMKMDIIQFIKVIGMVLIIRIMSGKVKR